MHLALNLMKKHIYICITSYIVVCLIIGLYVYIFLRIITVTLSFCYYIRIETVKANS